jgi:hypothetical protein
MVHRILCDKVWMPRKAMVYITELEPMQVSNALQRLKRRGLVESMRTNGPGSQVWRRKEPFRCPYCGREY